MLSLGMSKLYRKTEGHLILKRIQVLKKIEVKKLFINKRKKFYRFILRINFYNLKIIFFFQKIR